MAVADAAGAFPDEPRRMGRLLLDPVYGTYFVGKLASMSAIWVHTVVAAMLVWEITGSTLVVGLVSAGQFTPQIVLGPLSGAIADRSNLKVQLVVGRVVCLSGSVWLAVQLALVGVDGMGYLPVLLASFVVGLGFSIGGPAMQALLPDLVAPRELATAVVLDSVPLTLGRALGPALGGLVAGQGHYVGGFVLAAVGHAVFATVVASLRVRPRPARAPGSDVRVSAAVRYLRRSGSVVVALFGVAVVGYAADPAITLAPQLVERWGMGQGAIGACATAFGVGALLGYAGIALVLRVVSQPWVGAVGMAAMAAGSGAVALAPWAAAGFAALALTGAGMTMGLTGCTQWIYATVPMGLRGRIMGFWFVGFVGSRPIAAVVHGALGEWVGISPTLATTASLALASALLCLRFHVGHGR